MGYVLNINNNDNLETVIKKCNSNFQSLSKQSEANTIEVTTREVSSAVESIVTTIEAEAAVRSQKDIDLENAIETVNNRFANYALIADLPVVPVAPVDAAYLTFGSDDPADTYGGTWSLVSSLQVGTDSVNVWKKTAS